MRFGATLAALCGLLSFPLLADFSYQQTSKVTGGSILRMMRMIPGGGKIAEPQVSTHLLQGNRMASVSATSIDVIDLDRQVLTHIDLDRKTYANITFDELRQAMEALSRRLGQGQPDQASIEFRLDVQNTGETRNIQGLDTSLAKLLLAMDMKDQKNGQAATMNMEMDMWMAKDVPGYAQVRKFQATYAEKLGISPDMMRMGRMALGQPGAGEGMAKLMKEASKLQGVPVVQVTRMKGFGGPGAEGAESPHAQGPSGKDVGDAVGDSAASSAASALGRIPGMGGLGGRLGGLARRKREEPKPEPKPAQNTPPPAPPQQSVFMEMTSETSSFSTAAVDSSKFAVPAGFKEVEHDMKKTLREAK